VRASQNAFEPARHTGLPPVERGCRRARNAFEPARCAATNDDAIGQGAQPRVGGGVP